MNIDAALTTFLHDSIPHNSFTEFFFSFFSLIGTYAIVWLCIGVVLMVVQELRQRRFVITLSGALFTTLLTTYLMKIIFERARPVDIMAVSPACPTDFSFPSAHASLAFAGAYTLSYFDKKRQPLYYSIAVFISYSRIFLGCHYFFDVLVGSILGYLVARIFVHFVQSRHADIK